MTRFTLWSCRGVLTCGWSVTASTRTWSLSRIGLFPCARSGIPAIRITESRRVIECRIHCPLLIGDQLVAEVVFQPLHGFVRMLGWHTFVSGYTQPPPRRQIHGASADHQNLS